MAGIRQNYHQETEAAVNKQVNLELFASYVYQSMSWYFGRDDVALPGFQKYFDKLAEVERKDADKLVKYQTSRGGRVVLQDIQKPKKDEWGNGLEAMQVALDVAKNLNQSMLDLHEVAEKHNDAHLDDWIEDHFLTKEVTLIKQIGDHLSNLRRVGAGLGEYEFDKSTLQKDDSD